MEVLRNEGIGSIFLTSVVTSNECIAGTGQIPKRSDTSEYMKA